MQKSHTRLVPVGEHRAGHDRGWRDGEAISRRLPATCLSLAETDVASLPGPAKLQTRARKSVCDRRCNMSSAVSTFLRKQGHWTEEEYLALETNQLIDYANGAIEVLTMPTTSHQLMLLFIYRLLDDFVTARQLGTVVVAPLRIRLWSEKFREPDIVFMLRANSARMAEEFWD